MRKSSKAGLIGGCDFFVWRLLDGVVLALAPIRLYYDDLSFCSVTLM